MPLIHYKMAHTETVLWTSESSPVPNRGDGIVVMPGGNHSGSYNVVKVVHHYGATDVKHHSVYLNVAERKAE